MNENPQTHGASSGAGMSVALGFVLGALAGAGIALLLTPGTGRDNRRRLAETGERWGKAARTGLGRARRAASGLRQDAKAAFEAGREAFEHDRNPQEAGPALPTEPKR